MTRAGQSCAEVTRVKASLIIRDTKTSAKPSSALGAALLLFGSVDWFGVYNFSGVLSASSFYDGWTWFVTAACRRQTSSNRYSELLDN